MKESLFDPFRKQWVIATPEEIVRQQWLTALISDLAFPEELIAVEKSLAELPHLKNFQVKLPKRRADILCFSPASLGGHHPFLLIECKSVSLNESMKRQLLGYNYFVQAPFVALVNQKESFFAARTKDRYEFTVGIPSYISLLQCIQER